MINADPKVLAAFDLMIAGVDEVERRGATFPYVAVNGNMCATISKAGTIGIRLSDSDMKSFLAIGGTPFEAVPGIPLKSFGAIPPSMYGDRLQIQTWFRRAHGYTETLPRQVIKPPRPEAEPKPAPAAEAPKPEPAAETPQVSRTAT